MLVTEVILEPHTEDIFKILFSRMAPVKLVLDDTNIRIAAKKGYVVCVVVDSVLNFAGIAVRAAAFVVVLGQGQRSNVTE